MNDHDGAAAPARTTVLLADDHPALRAGIRVRVEADGQMQVVAEASDGQEAFELMCRHEPDVALVDLRMPVLDGMEVLAKAKDQHLRTSVILLSALTEAHLVQEALDRGAYGYIGKDSPLDLLAGAIRTVASGNRYIDPTLLASLLEPTDHRLTEREREVLQLAANGMQNKVIAIELGLGEETVKSHLSNVMRKLGAHSRTEAVAAALRRSLIT